MILDLFALEVVINGQIANNKLNGKLEMPIKIGAGAAGIRNETQCFIRIGRLMELSVPMSSYN